MTSAQTMTNHASFPSKQKAHLLSDQNNHHFPSTKTNTEHETLSKGIAQRSLRNTTATRMSLRTRDHSEKDTHKEPAVPSEETTRKSDTSPQTSSENVLQSKNGLFSNKFAGKWDRASEEATSEKEGRASEPPSSRKASIDDTGYNTRKHTRAAGYAMETEEVKGQNGSKKVAVDTTAGQQGTGYHLRSTEYKSGNRDTNFSDDFEYEYPGRHPTSTEGPAGNNSNSRTRGSRGQASSNTNRIDADQEEASSGRGVTNQKRDTTRSSKRNGAYNITFSEEISTLQVPADMPKRKRSVDDSRRSKSRLGDSTTDFQEENDDLKDNTKVDDESDSVASSVRSPTAGRGGNRRRGRRCLNRLCLTDTKISFLWAKEKVNSSAICKVCYSAFSQGHFCYFCSQIYLDDEVLTYSDDKDWISCDTCGCWNHMQCEAKHGIKNIFVILQKDKKTKYYCPKCRGDKDIKKPKVSSEKDQEAQGSTPPKNSSTNNTRRTARTEHQRPPWDDWLVCEEGLEEPPLSKKKVNAGSRGGFNTVEVSVSGDEDRDDEDAIKKRLDSLFSRASSRRRALQWKTQPGTVESFAEADRLMNQFCGKKMQLTDQEIKADLGQIKELFKLTDSNQGNSETNMSEMEVVETIIEETVEKSEDKESSEEEKIVIKTARYTRAKPQRRVGPRANERARATVVQTVVKEEKVISRNTRDRATAKTSAGKANEGNTSAAARMQLRTRKVN